MMTQPRQGTTKPRLELHSLRLLLILQVVSAQHLDVSLKGGATSGLEPAAGQAGLASMRAAGGQAAIVARSDSLSLHPMLPPPADALLADADGSADPAQSAKKRSRKYSTLNELGTAS